MSYHDPCLLHPIILILMGLAFSLFLPNPLADGAARVLSFFFQYTAHKYFSERLTKDSPSFVV